MSDLIDFREEVRTWLNDNAPPALFGTRGGVFDGFWGGRKGASADPDVIKWRDVMVDKGWTAPGWPTEYGGGGHTDAETRIIQEELRTAKLPVPVVGFGMAMIGPTLLQFGTPEQKAKHIPPIVRGDIRWCQGYSEPGAGSDLASLQTKAVPDGDHFVITGQKVWTSYAHLSDWIFCLVRTSTGERKQQGITFILIDMNHPGVSAVPIKLISGASPFCEVFFEEVPVPAENVVLEVDQGWTVAKALLRFERSMIGAATGGQMMEAEAELASLARKHIGPNEKGAPIDDAVVRQELAAYGMDQECFMLTIQRIAQSAKEGQPPGPESSILKVFGSELKQSRWSLATRIAGQQALGWEGPGFDADELDITRQWLRSRGNSIEGGTSEVQLNIIARRVLGLPK